MLNLLYSGEINPVEQIAAQDKKYQRYMKREASLREVLDHALLSEQRELLQGYRNSINDTDAYLQEKMFRVGFQLGMQIRIAAEGR